MQPGPDRQAIVVGPIADGAGAADRAGGPIEGGQKAVASCLDLVASVATEFTTDGRIVPGQHVAPAPVTQLGSTRGRTDDIGEQDGDQHAVAAFVDYQPDEHIPDPERHQLYSSAYHRYREVYYALKPVFEKVET